MRFMPVLRLTLLFTCCCLFTYILFQAPPWAYIACACGLFIYQSLDAIDGKQARRTNSSSPLGELFDHGCDSLSTGTALDNGLLSNFMRTKLSKIFLCSNKMRIMYLGCIILMPQFRTLVIYFTKVLRLISFVLAGCSLWLTLFGKLSTVWPGQYFHRELHGMLELQGRLENHKVILSSSVARESLFYFIPSGLNLSLRLKCLKYVFKYLNFLKTLNHF